MDNYKINHQEMQKQMRDNIIKQDHYITINIVVGEGSNEAFSSSEGKNPTLEQVMIAIDLMEGLKKEYLKNDEMKKAYELHKLVHKWKYLKIEED